jgi:hypothetical protein
VGLGAINEAVAFIRWRLTRTGGGTVLHPFGLLTPVTVAGCRFHRLEWQRNSSLKPPMSNSRLTSPVTPQSETLPSLMVAAPTGDEQSMKAGTADISDILEIN